MNRKRKTLLLTCGLLALCLACGVAAGIGSNLWVFWQKPLAPPLELPAFTPTVIAWNTPVPTATPAMAYASLPAFSMPPATPSNTPLPEIPPMPAVETLAPAFAVNDPLHCGGSGSIQLLAIGTDTRSNDYMYGLADMIRLVRVDFDLPGVSVLEIPRDLWVEIPDTADNLDGQDHERLNQAYLYGNTGFGYTNDPARGPGLLARTLALNFGARIDHYAAVNMYTFVRVVNKLGGIDVELPYRVDGRAPDQPKRMDLVFDAGRHHLNGEQALMLGRLRQNGVFERAEVQNYVLCGLRDKLSSPRVIPQIPSLIAAFRGSVQTDLSPEQISQLACLGLQMPRQNIRFHAIPEEYFKGTRIYDPVFKGRVFIWDVDYNILRTYIEAFQRGDWPQESAPGTPAPDPSASIFYCP